MAEIEKGDTEWLLRLVAAAQTNLVALKAAREMFSKSYFSLSVFERETVDKVTAEWVVSVARAIPEEPQAQDPNRKPKQAGFRVTPPAEAA